MLGSYWQWEKSYYLRNERKGIVIYKKAKIYNFFIMELFCEKGILNVLVLATIFLHSKLSILLPKLSHTASHHETLKWLPVSIRVKSKVLAVIYKTWQALTSTLFLTYSTPPTLVTLPCTASLRSLALETPFAWDRFPQTFMWLSLPDVQGFALITLSEWDLFSPFIENHTHTPHHPHLLYFSL